MACRASVSSQYTIRTLTRFGDQPLAVAAAEKSGRVLDDVKLIVSNHNPGRLRRQWGKHLSWWSRQVQVFRLRYSLDRLVGRVFETSLAG
jgi:hypothetical protein